MRLSEQRGWSGCRYGFRSGTRREDNVDDKMEEKRAARTRMTRNDQ